MNVWSRSNNKFDVSANALDKMTKRHPTFTSEKTAAAPEVESLAKSKPVKAAISFASGFAAAYLATTWIYNSACDGFETRLLVSSFTLGSANMMRNVFFSPEENNKDTKAFLKWGLPTGVIALGFFKLQMYTIAVGTVCGLTSVAYRRVRDAMKAKN